MADASAAAAEKNLGSVTMLAAYVRTSDSRSGATFGRIASMSSTSLGLNSKSGRAGDS